MSSNYYYNNYQNNPYPNSTYREPPPFPFHLCIFLTTLFLFIWFTWYITYDSLLESLFDQFKFLIILSPLILLLVAHFFSNSLDFFSSPQEREGFRGGSPWGVGLILVLLLFMISYQGCFQARWFPLLTHR